MGRAIALQPDWPRVLSKLGIVRGELGQLNEAAATLRRAIALTPAFPWHCMFEDVEEVHRFDEPAELRQAIIVYQLAELHCKLGTVLMRLGRLDAAVPTYREAVASTSPKPRTTRKRSAEVGRAKDAFVAYASAIAWSRTPPRPTTISVWP